LGALSVVSSMERREFDGDEREEEEAR